MAAWKKLSASSKKSPMKNKAAEDIFRKKRKRRRRLAKLSFEKKIEIVVELQKMAAPIRKDPRHIIWPI